MEKNNQGLKSEKGNMVKGMKKDIQEMKTELENMENNLRIKLKTEDKLIEVNAKKEIKNQERKLGDKWKILKLERKVEKT